jgi:hypothetical protein
VVLSRSSRGFDAHAVAEAPSRFHYLPGLTRAATGGE